MHPERPSEVTGVPQLPGGVEADGVRGRRKVRTLLLGLIFLLGACGEPSSPASQTALAPLAGSKSAKRGIAYDLASAADLAALAPGVSWWYNWSPSVNGGVPTDYNARYGVDFYPMLWNGAFDTADAVRRIRANPQAQYLLVMNEPNLTDQANLTPAQAADIWPRYEGVARETGVKIVGPQMTWGTLPGYNDPVVWLDAFYAAYRNKNGGRDPQIDFLGFHWYDYGLAGQLDRLKKYGKPFWVTEFANWHSQPDGAQIDTVAKQKAQMAELVATLEARPDVFRYAWFTGRWPNDVHFTSLLGASGQLTELGRYYLSLPYNGSSSEGDTCGTANLAQGKPSRAFSTESSGTPASAAFDGNTSTRWSSVFSDPQWLQVDLGSPQRVCGVTLQWEAAYGKTFEVQVSNDAATWTPVYSTSSGTGGTQTLKVSGSGRYVRLYGTQRATGYGYSLFEFKVYGAP